MYRKIIHAVVALILFAIPVVLQVKGGWQDISIGALLNLIYLTLSQIYSPTAKA